MYYDAYDTEELRKAIMDYYGTAMTEGNTLAIDELEKARTADESELVEMAYDANIDPEDFII